MKLKNFQKQDLARAALHDGLIKSWDTGLGKTWAAYLWALLKLGYTKEAIGLYQYVQSRLEPGVREQSPNAIRIRPNKPVLIVAPGDLHQQIIDEGWNWFGIVVAALDSQSTFATLTTDPVTGRSQGDTDGKPTIAPDFYITSYTQLTTNGVERPPQVKDWPNIVALQQLLCLQNGDHVPIASGGTAPLAGGRRASAPATPPPGTDAPPTTCEFFAQRGTVWSDEWLYFSLDPVTATLSTLEAAYQKRQDQIAQYRGDPKLAEEEAEKAKAAYEVLKMLIPDGFSSTAPPARGCGCQDEVRPSSPATPPPDTHEPHFSDLNSQQKDFVTRHFLHDFLTRCSVNDGAVVTYQKWSDGKWKTKPLPGTTPTPHSELPTPQLEVAREWKIKCVYSPSLSDLAYRAFDAVVVDEGVKMKGVATYVGAGVRQMDPPYRLVLTATPVKNRLPDLFWLAHWATGGRDEAHARWPYGSDPSNQTEFADTFMVSEHNLTKEAAAAESNRSGSSRPGRYKKLTAEVCNVHRLWKLLGSVILRRRKDDCNEDIPPKIRKVIRCKMGTRQADVYAYHLQAEYLDKDGEDAIGARLQALRIAAADPSAVENLREQPGNPLKPCECVRQPVPPAEQCKRLQAERVDLMKILKLEDGGTVPPAGGCGASSPATSPPDTSVPCADDDENLSADELRLAAIHRELTTPVQRYESKPPEKNCPVCQGQGGTPLPHVSPQPFIPKHACVLNLVAEILEREEQVLIGSAFNGPLDRLAEWLTESQVRHLKLDGRTSQKKRGQLASVFKRGRAGTTTDRPVPVMLAGVECMAEGHSFHLANNVILLAYSWALDKFIQFINRVHRMTSPRPVNVYVVICDGSIDRKLESLVHEKNDSAELVLDGRLMGERAEEVNLAQLLQIAQREFDPTNDTIDEGLIHAQWPALRDRLRIAMADWDRGCQIVHGGTVPPARGAVRPAQHGYPSGTNAGLPPKTRLRRDPLSGAYSIITDTVTHATSLPPPPVTPCGTVPLAGGRRASAPATSPPDMNAPCANNPSDLLRPVRAEATLVLAAASDNPWDLL